MKSELTRGIRVRQVGACAMLIALWLVVAIPGHRWIAATMFVAGLALFASIGALLYTRGVHGRWPWEDPRTTPKRC
jgi:hypothetical protein